MAEEKIINVLWIDDKHEELKATIGRAKQAGVMLHPFKSKNGGLTELKSNLGFYDGVLLDARCYENEDDTDGTEDTQHSIDARQEIQLLDKKFEIFVLTGQSEEHIDGSYKKMFKNVYEKGNNEHFKELMQRLIEAAQNLPDTQIKHKYASVFRLANKGLISAKNNERLIDLANYLESEKDIDEKELTPIRKIIENLFSYLKDISLVPAELVDGQGSISKTSKFLASIEVNYIYHEELIPAIISENIHRLLNLTQDGAHGDGTLRLEVDNYLASRENKYLFKSAVYLLFDILSWFGDNIQNHQDKDFNNAKWEKKEGHGQEIEGKIIKVERDFGTFVSNSEKIRCSIPPPIMREFRLIVGQSLTIVTKPDPKNEVNTHIDRIVRL